MRARLALVAILLAASAPRAAAEPFADAVLAYTIGAGGGARAIDLPGIVLGPPHGAGPFQGSAHTFSLGLGGSIVLAFTDNVIVDRPGPDFTVFENPFLVTGAGTTQPPYAEPGTVSVSADGVHWVPFPCALDAPPYYPGCAGIYPVFANVDDPSAPSPLEPSTTPIAALVGVPLAGFTPPAGSGGDSFDLAAVGLAAARFVRIDASQIDTRLGGLSGFDLDAVAAVHSVDTAGAPDTDGDGFPDAADSCPTVANPDQRDADGDGIGDACDVEVPPDADGDGVPDTTDDCPSVPNADQADTDGDGLGDACDDCPTRFDPLNACTGGPGDGDGDGIPDALDDCPAIPDPAQADSDGDGIGDACDRCPGVADAAQVDTDGDGVGDACDVCPSTPDAAQADSDGDGAGDLCDPCPNDATCLPAAAPRFAGDGRPGPAEVLLTYAAPAGARTSVAAGVTVTTIAVVVSPDVVPGSVRVRVGRRALVTGTITPGTTKLLTIPLARRRTAVRLRAVGPPAGRRRLVDIDHLTFERSPP